MLLRYGDLRILTHPVLRETLDLQFCSIRRVLRNALKTFPVSGKRVLDFGTGIGPYRDLLGGAEIKTVDPSFPSDWDRLEDVPREERFDRILVLEVLEHLPDPEETLRELAGRLASGGQMWITVPFSARIHRAPEDYYRWTDTGLKHLIEKAGLKVLRMESRGNAWTSLCARYFFGLVQLGSHPIGALAAALLGVLTVPWLLPLGHLSLRLRTGRSQEPLGFFALAETAAGDGQKVAGP